MKNPHNTRPYRVPPKPGVERQRKLMLYMAAISGPIAMMVMIAAAALAWH